MKNKIERDVDFEFVEFCVPGNDDAAHWSKYYHALVKDFHLKKGDDLKANAALMDLLKNHGITLEMTFERDITMDELIKGIEKILDSEGIPPPFKGTTPPPPPDVQVFDFPTVAQDAVALVDGLRFSLDKAKESGKERAGKNLIKTGVERIDEMLNGGFREGLYGLAARPGMGKTSLSLELARSVAVSRKVLFFTLEMSRRELLAILMSWNTSRVPPAVPKVTILDDSVNAIELEKLSLAAKYCLDFDSIRIVDDARNVFDISERVGQFQDRSPDDTPLVILDYLQIVQPGEKERVRDERLMLKGIVYKLKKLSNQYHIPVLLISSIPRDFYRDKDKKPDPISAFKESGDIEFALSGGFYLESIPDQESGAKKPLRLVMVKNRWGRCFDDAGSYLKYNFNLDMTSGEITPAIFLTPKRKRKTKGNGHEASAKDLA